MSGCVTAVFGREPNGEKGKGSGQKSNRADVRIRLSEDHDDIPDAFSGGNGLCLRASCTYASGIYINVNVMKETSSGLLVGEGSMALAVLAGCIHFLALGCIWRVVCEWGYRLIKRLYDEKDSCV